MDLKFPLIKKINFEEEIKDLLIKNEEFNFLILDFEDSLFSLNNIHFNLLNKIRTIQIKFEEIQKKISLLNFEISSEKNDFIKSNFVSKNLKEVSENINAKFEHLNRNLKNKFEFNNLKKNKINYIDLEKETFEENKQEAIQKQ